MNKIKSYMRKGLLIRKIMQKVIFCFRKILVFIFIHERDYDNNSFDINYKFYIFLKRKYKTYLRDNCNYSTYEKTSNTKIIWWSWLQGEENAPDLCKRCLESLRLHMKNYEIRIITENNLTEYISIPDSILLKYKKKYIGEAHFSDIIRTLLLIKYGGVWIDSTVFCTGYSQNLFDLPLFFYSNVMRGDNGIICSNWLISSSKNNPILCTTRDLLFKFWENHNYSFHYYLYHFFFHMAAEKYKDILDEVPVISNIPPHIMQNELLKKNSMERINYYKSMSDFHKLTYKLETSEIKENTLFSKLLNGELNE